MPPTVNTPPVVNQERINISVGVDVGGQAFVASDLAADDDGEDHGWITTVSTPALTAIR